MLGLFLASVALSATLVGASLLPGEVEATSARRDGRLLSLRFWILFALGFGLAGIPLALLNLGPLLAVGAALAAGTALSRLLWPLFEESSGEVTLSGLEGAEGRALLPVDHHHGKIVVTTLASRVELPARTGDGRRIERGDRILVAFVQDGVARVIRL